MWDNRDKKTNPKAPDFKCKDKENCDGVIWPESKDEVPEPQSTLEAVDSLDGELESLFGKEGV